MAMEAPGMAMDGLLVLRDELSRRTVGIALDRSSADDMLHAAFRILLPLLPLKHSSSVLKKESGTLCFSHSGSHQG